MFYPSDLGPHSTMYADQRKTASTVTPRKERISWRHVSWLHDIAPWFEELRYGRGPYWPVPADQSLLTCPYWPVPTDLSLVSLLPPVSCCSWLKGFRSKVRSFRLSISSSERNSCCRVSKKRFFRIRIRHLKNRIRKAFERRKKLPTPDWKGGENRNR